MQNDISTVAKLLTDFSSLSEKRSIIFLVNLEEVFPKILDWKFIAWKQNWLNWKNKEKREEWLSWVELSHKFDTLITRIGERSFEKERLQFMFSVAFLKHFQTHVNFRKDEYVVVEERKKYYVTDLFRLFYNVLFKFVETAEPTEKKYFWSVFPKEWKITKRDNLGLAWLSYNNFMVWVSPRIIDNPESDLVLNEVTENLFPKVDIRTWSRILIFVLSPYGENRVKSVIERNWSFGFRIRTIVSTGKYSPKEVYQQLTAEDRPKIERAYELALSLYKSTFTEKMLKKYKTDARKLKYPSNTSEGRKKKELLKIFDGLLHSLQNTSAPT